MYSAIQKEEGIVSMTENQQPHHKSKNNLNKLKILCILKRCVLCICTNLHTAVHKTEKKFIL